MRTVKIIKPDLTVYFNAMPYIGRYMAYDYENANSYNELIMLFHKWMNESEMSKNMIRKRHFKAAAHYIYALITKRSFESVLE